MKATTLATIALPLLLSCADASRATVLYDASLGTDPASQGLVYGSLPLTSFYTFDGTGTTLNTSSSNSIFAGFSNRSPLTLDRSVGFDVSISAKVIAGAQTNTSRAGFSIIALGSDERGIEIGFHDNEVFAQDDGANLFVRAESAAFDTTTTVTSYDLHVLGDAYTLSANGATILSGRVRDYTTFTGPINPYTTPNFLFFGDDSTSASGTTLFSRIDVQTPEPASLAVLALLPVLSRRKRTSR